MMSVERLLEIVTPPAATDRLESWSSQVPLLALLGEQRTGRSLVLYGSTFNGGSMMIHSVLVPRSALDGIQLQALTQWQGNPYDSWSCGLVWGGGRPPRVELDRSRSNFEDIPAEKTEQLIFGRSFEGRGEDRRYFEIAPVLSHAHGLHWVPERHAWCRFDDHGDIADVIRWTEVKGREGYGEAVWIEIDRDVIEMQMAASDMVLIQMFDSTCPSNSFSGWGEGEDRAVSDDDRDLHYRCHLEGARGSWFRGVQIIKPRRTSEELGAHLRDEQERPKAYESFITQDWKNGKVLPVSCSPDAIASYFEKDSPLPFHTSPVFFNAAVLDKYKADPEKYSLEHRSISCRNAWHLQTYDVNEQGQVHTYIKYLGDLPLSEQTYWKAFNEPPKGKISDRAYKTDFEGSWDDHPDPLRYLQDTVTELHGKNVPWFKLREPDVVWQLHYPLTASTKTWGDTLTTLAKIVVEGLDKKFFETIAKARGVKGEAAWGSIKWISECLSVCGVDAQVAAGIVEPLRTVQALRTKLDAHSGGEEAKALRAKLLKEFRTPKAHVARLCAMLDEALKQLEALRSEESIRNVP